jgi:ABC-2 type transport system permease protein
MRNFWLVAKRAYRNTVGRRGFLIGTLAIPLGFAALIGLAILVETLNENDLPLGYVDNAGVIEVTQQDVVPRADDGIKIRVFPDKEVAMAALERAEVQAFFVFRPNYQQTLRTDLYYLEDPPSDNAWGEFNDFVRLNLVATLPEEVQGRLLEGPDITVKDIVSNREFSKSAIINVILPFVASVFFFITTMSAGGYMLGVVANEKENRTIEIMVTSVTPGQLIGGKAAGLLAASLTQLFLYFVAAVVGLKVAAPHVAELQQATVPWMYLGVTALFFLPAFALIAAVMVALGAAVTELQQGQQLMGLLNLFFMLPLFLMGVLFGNPGHPLMVFMTLFPTTAFLTISLRWGLGTIPVWQLGASWVLLVATTIFMVWAAARIFRAGMLRYGQPLTLKTALVALRTRG